MKARVRFSKNDDVKYVGHLDTMRTFTRCIKRTAIPVEYSKGFNPRVQISFALPLGVGVTSDSEYFDLDVNLKMNESIFLGELNSTLPSGFKVHEVKYIEDTNKSLMALVKEAIYEIKIDTASDFNDIIKLFDEQSIIIEKETNSKNKIQEINLKDYIINVDADSEKKILTIKCTAGSVNNMNPNFVIKAIEKYVGKVDDFEIHRRELILE